MLLDASLRPRARRQRQYDPQSRRRFQPPAAPADAYCPTRRAAQRLVGRALRVRRGRCSADHGRPNRRSRAADSARCRRSIRPGKSPRLDTGAHASSTRCFDRRLRRSTAAHRCAATSQRLAAMRNPTRQRTPLRAAAAGATSHWPTRTRPEPGHRASTTRCHPRRARRPMVQDRVQQRTRSASEPAQARRPHHACRRDADHPCPRDE